MENALNFPKAPFRTAQHHINSLCRALAYAATDPDGEMYVRPFLKTVEARQLLNEAAKSVEEYGR